MKKYIDFSKYRLRTCRSLHGCEVCRQDITFGQKYYDGGYGKRAHDLCADALNMEREATRKFLEAQEDFYGDAQ